MSKVPAAPGAVATNVRENRSELLTEPRVLGSFWLRGVVRESRWFPRRGETPRGPCLPSQAAPTKA